MEAFLLRLAPGSTNKSPLQPLVAPPIERNRQLAEKARWFVASFRDPVRRVCVKRGAGMDESETRRRLEALRTEHRDLDMAIDALRGTGSADQLQLARLKKRKLRLRDEITQLEDQLVPDIIA